jgi:hypothetical protein
MEVFGQHYALATSLPGNNSVTNLIGDWVHSEPFGENKYLLTLPRFEPRIVQ